MEDTSKFGEVLSHQMFEIEISNRANQIEGS